LCIELVIYKDFHQILCYFFESGRVGTRQELLTASCPPQTMLTCIVINTPNLVGYTWVECSIRDSPWTNDTRLGTDHTCTAHCQNYLRLAKVDGPPKFGKNTRLSEGVFIRFLLLIFSMFTYRVTLEDGTDKSHRNAGKTRRPRRTRISFTPRRKISVTKDINLLAPE